MFDLDLTQWPSCLTLHLHSDLHGWPWPYTVTFMVDLDLTQWPSWLTLTLHVDLSPFCRCGGLRDLARSSEGRSDHVAVGNAQRLRSASSGHRRKVHQTETWAGRVKERREEWKKKEDWEKQWGKCEVCTIEEKRRMEKLSDVSTKKNGRVYNVLSGWPEENF